MQDRFGHRVSYLRISVTDRCNERCLYCMPRELQEWLPHSEVLTYAEITRLVQVAASLGVTKIRVTGGEPLTRRNVLGLFQQLSFIESITDIGISTNGTLLAKRVETGLTVAESLAQLRVKHLNVSLDTLDQETYAIITGRDALPETLLGLEAGKRAGFAQIRLNSVLIRGKNEEGLGDLVRFARKQGFLLRFIELMPVTTSEVLSDENFFPVALARRNIEAEFGPLIPEPGFHTNGPALYYRFEDHPQRIGFIGAMTNLHFCESCNKLRLTCDGKLRPCLGSHLEFDIKAPLRAGASDEELRQLFLEVVDRKPEQHDFRFNYKPGRKMVAIGG
ncbi:MAG TPA: GTP 3',8-cyclase MoaA [Chthoniobacterales bacterium]|nr:GTP 3',8-cyclase MoaA [Chthoniobacterales bacterium]